jgi:hypothetical protein
MYCTFRTWLHVYACDVSLLILTKSYPRNFQRPAVTMKLILVLLASALSMAQAARLGLLRVDSHGPMKERPASADFGSTRNLQKEDAFLYV